jgi:hypothetical protein
MSKRDYKTLKVRVSESEFKEIQKRKPENLSLADWLRTLAMGEEIQVKRQRRPVPKADPELIRHWAKIGGNLNQIARALNTANKIGEPVNLAQILATLKAIEQNLDRSVQGTGSRSSRIRKGNVGK